MGGRLIPGIGGLDFYTPLGLPMDRGTVLCVDRIVLERRLAEPCAGS
ncbi:hypothetical protein ACNPQM_23315 [Streptomyces sp. NPDC056231]